MELYNFELSDGKMFGPRRPVCLLYSQYMGIHGNSWEFMGIYGNSWESMGFLMKALLSGRWISLPDSDQMTGDVRHPPKVWGVEV